MEKTFLEAGRLVATHGVRGELKLLPATDDAAFLRPFRTLYWQDGTAVRVTASRVQGSCLLLKLEGVETVETAAQLVNRVLCFRRDDPAIPAGTVFVDDLIGLPVFADGAQIGRLTEVIKLPASDVYVVKGEREYMIPAVPAFVDKVVLSEGRVNVRLIEGMETGES